MTAHKQPPARSRVRHKAAGPSTARFDARYYARFYGRGGAHDRRRISHLATAVHHLAAWWGINVRSVLDVGSGVGMWRDWYTEHHPATRVLSIDISEHACSRWGHRLLDISEWTPPRQHDLVICHSVIQYLDDQRAGRALDNLAAGCRHVLYLEIPTARDLADIVDPGSTDMSVHRRTGAWYRRRLAAHFVQAGAGLWIKRGSVALYELEGTGSGDR